MKPGVTVITVARKPLSEGSVAENVLKWEAGGLNIDGARLACDDHPGVHKREGDVFSPTLKGKPKTKDSGIYHIPSGRWPSNIVFQHLPGCRCEGVKGIRADWGQPTRGAELRLSGVYSPHLGGATGKQVGYADPETGIETVPNWACVEGCPVAGLDDQSFKGGIHSAGKAREKDVVSPYRASSYHAPTERQMNRHGDSGGASRFFKQVKSE